MTDAGGGVADITIPGEGPDIFHNFVFNPFGVEVPGDNLFTDWATLVAAAQQGPTEGYKQIQFDNTRRGEGDSLTVPAAGTVRLFDAEGLFTAGMVGRQVVIAGSSIPANNGSFTVTAFIAPDTIEFANAAGVAEPVFNGVWVVIFGTVVIPPGVWDMTQIELTGFHNPAAVAGAGGIPVTISDGASFMNLRKVGGDVILTNLNNLPNPAPVTISQGAIFEFGLGPQGDFPQIINMGTQAFFDLSLLPAGQNLALRMAGPIQGPTASIDFGANAGRLLLNLQGSARIDTGAIRGTNPAALVSILTIQDSAQFSRQNTPASPFAGNIAHNQQSTGAAFWNRMVMIPQSVNQAPPVPGGPFANATGLGHNTTLTVTSAGVVVQPLPIIRAAAPANSLASTSPGALDSTGMLTVVKHLGAGSVNVTPSPGETIDGGPGPVVVPSGGSRIFQSDGVSNWVVVGGYL